MVFRRPADAYRIDAYTGPYERWTFSQELGGEFAFPALRKSGKTHYTALFEGEGQPSACDAAEVRVPPLWLENGPVTPFAMAMKPMVGRAQVQQDVRLAEALDQIGGTRYRLNLPVHADTWPRTYRPEDTLDGWTPPAQPPRAIIGVVDDGLPFLHRAFRDANEKSRIAACWLQAARAAQSAAVPFGREVLNTEIDALHARFATRELAAYREVGAIDPKLPELGRIMQNHASHGAHILGLAAGNDPHIQALDLPEDALVIAVQLPNTIAWDTSGFGKEMMMLSAIEYICHRARAIADHYGVAELPLVMNFSYGWSANRHDGKAGFERGVEALLAARKAVQPETHLLMPTGNNFANKMHARFMRGDAGASGKMSFGWHVKPGDRTSSFVEVWLPEALGDPVGWKVEVAPPQGVALVAPAEISVSPDPGLNGGDPRRFLELEIDGEIIGQLSADKHFGDRWRVMLALIPTVAQGRRCPIGLWTVTLKTGTRPLPAGQAIDVWVQRDDDPDALRTGGQQSTLVDLNNAPRSSTSPLESPALTPMRGYGCLNGIGTAPSVTRVAGYVECTGEPTDYSGAGGIAALPGGQYRLDPAQPAVTAVSDQGFFLKGLPSIGITSGSGARIVGTSAASAAVTRAVAQNILAGRPALAGFAQVPAPPEETSEEAVIRLSRQGPLRVPPICGAKFIAG